MTDTGIQEAAGSATPSAAADTTMWTGLLHSGLVGSFLRLPHVPPDTAIIGHCQVGVPNLLNADGLDSH